MCKNLYFTTLQLPPAFSLTMSNFNSNMRSSFTTRYHLWMVVFSYMIFFSLFLVFCGCCFASFAFFFNSSKTLFVNVEIQIFTFDRLTKISNTFSKKVQVYAWIKFVNLILCILSQHLNKFSKFINKLTLINLKKNKKNHL